MISIKGCCSSWFDAANEVFELFAPIDLSWHIQKRGPALTESLLVPKSQPWLHDFAPQELG